MLHIHVARTRHMDAGRFQHPRVDTQLAGMIGGLVVGRSGQAARLPVNDLAGPVAIVDTADHRHAPHFRFQTLLAGGGRGRTIQRQIQTESAQTPGRHVRPLVGRDHMSVRRDDILGQRVAFPLVFRQTVALAFQFDTLAA